MRKVSYFQIGDLLPIGMTIIVTVIAIAYGLLTIGQVGDGIGKTNCAARTDGYLYYNATTESCSNSSVQSNNMSAVGTAEFNSTTDGVIAVKKITDNMSTVVTITIAAVIIGVLISYLAVRFMK